MSDHTVSHEILKQDGTAAGSQRVLMDENGIKTTTPAHHWHNDAVLHQYTVRNIDLIATAVDRPIFTPPHGVWVLAGCSYVNRVVGSDGSAVTADIMACNAGDAPASGTTQLVAADSIDLKATADTPKAVALAATLTEVGPGKYFGLNVTGTLTAVVSMITLEFKRVR